MITPHYFYYNGIVWNGAYIGLHGMKYGNLDENFGV